MTAYINLTTKAYPVTEQMIRDAHPTTSFAYPFSPPAGYAFVFPVPTPTHDSFTQGVREIAPIKSHKGHYEQRFEVYDFSLEQINAALLATQSQLVPAIVEATQKRLDDFAATRNYAGIMSACTYVSSKIPKFKLEGQYCSDMRDATWAFLYDYMDRVNRSEAVPPKSFADVEPLLPTLSWPE